MSKRNAGQGELFPGYLSARDQANAYMGWEDAEAYGAERRGGGPPEPWGDRNHPRLAPHYGTPEYDLLRLYPEDWKADVTTLSFGGGVQSTALLLLVAHRDPRLEAVLMGDWPSVAIFSDPGDEKESTYEHVGAMIAYCAARGLEVRVVQKTDPQGEPMRLSEQVMGARRFAIPPFFAASGGCQDGMGGMLRRSCTAEYKREVIHKEVRRMLGVPTMRGLRHDCWLGISAEEPQRAKRTDIAWQRRLHPLLSMGWRRAECLEYITQLGIEAPRRSSCVWCPYHSNAEWRRLYQRAQVDEGSARDWARVVEMDAAIRDMGGRGGIKCSLALHPSGRPIEDVARDLVSQQTLFGDGLDYMDDEECGGYCHS